MKKRILYVIFVVITLAFFLYILFPKETLEDYVDYQIYRLNPDFRLALDDLKLHYPPYVKVSDATLYHQQKPIVTVSSALMRPGLATLFKTGTIVAFKGGIQEGRFGGRVSREGDSSEGRTIVDINLNGISLEDIEGIRAISNLTLSGRVAGKVVFHNENAQPGQGKADLIFSDCLLQLANAVFDIKTLRFNRIEMDLTIDGRTVTVNRVEMTGPQTDASFDGTIVVKEPFDRSALNVKGNVRLHAEFMARLKKKIPAPLWPKQQDINDGLPVSVSGTIKHPQLGVR